MKRLLAALLLSLPMSSALAPAVHAAPRRDWTRVVSPTPQGTYVLGNPAAKVKLVEYLSFTCSHCAHFTGEAMPVLRSKYIASGQLSLELRNAVRDGFDLAATLLSRCQGPRQIFPATEQLMAAQQDWFERGLAFSRTAQDKLKAMPVAQSLLAVAQGSGLQALMQKRGLSPAAAKACLTDQAAIDRVSAIADEAWRGRQIKGTPTFLINGQAVEGAVGWAVLEPKLLAALK